MAERYTRLFTLPANLYTEGSPVLIAAGALLKDNQTDRVLAQLKFKSICDRQISALKILVTGRDMSDEVVCREEHQYLDLRIKRDGEWGSKEAIPLEHSVRSFTAKILAVYYDDGGRCFMDENEWLSIPAQQPLSSRLFDGELIRQYKLDTTAKSANVPLEYSDLWLCSCGGINRSGEKCHACGEELEKLNETLNVEKLREEKNERLREEAEKEKENDVRRADNARHLGNALRIFIPIAAAMIVVSLLYIRAADRENDYEMANALLLAEKYDEAYETFEKLGNYKDAAEKAAGAKNYANDIYAYRRAMSLLESEHYDEAYEEFTALDDYSDSADRAKEAMYLKALECIGTGDYETAGALLTELDDYRDAPDMARSFVVRLGTEVCAANAECGGPLTTEYKYDLAGRLSEKRMLFSAYEGMSDRVYTYSYDDDGSYTETLDGFTLMYDKFGNLLGHNGEYVYEYDYGYYDDGSLRYCDAYNVSDGGFAGETKFDERGNKTEYTAADGTVQKITNEYDGDKLMQQTVSLSDGSIVERRSYEYDESGLPCRSVYMNADGTVSATEYVQTLVYAPELKTE